MECPVSVTRVGCQEAETHQIRTSRIAQRPEAGRRVPSIPCRWASERGMVEKSWRRQRTQLTRWAFGHWGINEVFYKTKYNFVVVIRMVTGRRADTFPLGEAVNQCRRLSVAPNRSVRNIKGALLYPNSVKTRERWT